MQNIYKNVKFLVMLSYKYYMIDYVATKKKKKKMSAKTKFRIFLLFLLVLIILCFVYYFKVICPIIVGLSQEKVRSVATSTISTVVGDVMEEGSFSYNNLVSITYSSENKVELIEVDTVKVNIIIREITQRVQQEFDTLADEGIDIALGTFSGIPFLFGIGPNVSINLVPIGTISTKVSSNFNSAGINQTLHRLYFIVNSNIGLVMPGTTQNFQTELEVLLCENIIIGEIPNVYLQGSLI